MSENNASAQRWYVPAAASATWQRRQVQRQDPGFFADVRTAIGFWRGNLVVPVLVAVIAVGQLIPSLISEYEKCTIIAGGICVDTRAGDRVFLYLLYAFLLALQAGLTGALRVWYVRRSEGTTMTFGQVWRLSWRFFTRFTALGALVLLLSLPVVVLALIGSSGHARVVMLVVGAVVAFVIDVAFTFATTGLALYDGRPWSAVTKGLRLLPAGLPFYALVPSLSLSVFGRAFTSELGWPLSNALVVLAPLLGFVVAGATTLFTQRRFQPMSEDGSVAG